MMRTRLASRVLLIALTALVLPLLANAQSPSTNFSYEGRAYQSDGTTPLTAANTTFTLSIIGSVSNSCVVYEETQTANLSTSDGYFSLTVGSGSVTATDSGHTLSQVFSTQAAVSGKSSVNGSACTIGTSETRRLAVKLNDGTTTVALDPPVAIGSSPYATVAHTLNGKSSSDFIQIAGSITKSLLDDLASEHTALMALAQGTSSLYVKTSDAANSIGGKTVDSTISSLSAVGSDNGKVLTWNSTLQKWTAQSPAAALTPTSTFSGDVSGTASTLSVDKIKGKAVTLGSYSTGQTLRYDGTQWTNAPLAISDISGLTTSLGSKIDSTQMPAGCSAGETLTFSSPTGTWTCSDIIVTASNFGSQPQGTVLAAPAASSGTPNFRAIASTDLPSTIGPTGASGLTLQTNATSRLKIDSSGNVGIGTDPTAKLDINGQARTKVYGFSSGTSVDWNNGNIQYTSGSCSSFSMANMLDGAAYTLIIKGSSGSCSFSATGLTFYYAGNQSSGIPITRPTAFSFIRAGTDVYVTWVSF